MTTSENAGASVGGSPVGRPFASPSDSGDRRTGAASGRKGDMEHLGVHGGVGGSGRLGRRQLVALSDQLSARDRAILGTVERFRLVRGDQLQRLHFNTITTSTGAARVARRSLQRLVESGLLARTERRVGGTGSGSTAHSYVLTAAGRRMVALARGDGAVSDRGLHEPGLRFHQHTLAITELHVRLVEAAWVGPLEVVAFVPEPGSWRQTAPGGVLKPDAFVIVATGEFEQLWMVEVDLATGVAMPTSSARTVTTQ